jgi:hypothetical protein
MFTLLGHAKPFYEAFMSRKPLFIHKETLRILSAQEGDAVQAGAVRTNQDSICWMCYSKPVFQNTVIVGNTCIQD